MTTPSDPQTPLTPEHVQEMLDSFNLGLRITLYDVSTATSEEAAQVVGCQLGQIAKSICLFVDGRPIVVVTSGDQLVDDRKIAAHFGISRKKVRMAKADECLSVFGYMPGSVPPLAYRTPDIPRYLDAFLKRWGMIYAAGGAPNAIFPVALPHLEMITSGTFLDVARETA